MKYETGKYICCWYKDKTNMINQNYNALLLIRFVNWHCNFFYPYIHMAWDLELCLPQQSVFLNL